MGSHFLLFQMVTISEAGVGKSGSDPNFLLVNVGDSTFAKGN
jgi:hypothetical protein